MPPSRTSLDPDGYYAKLDLTPDATRDAIIAAYRAKARRLHPDVPVTGSAAAFLALKQAYDVLSNPSRRSGYDRNARTAAIEAIEPVVYPVRPVHFVTPASAIPETRSPRISDMPVLVWAGLGLLLAFGIVQAVVHVGRAPKDQGTDIPPTAPPVAPLTEMAQREVLYGPPPAHLPGTANFYITPTGGNATLYQRQPDQKTFTPVGQLPPFSTVQGLRLYRENGFVEVLTGEQATAFIQAAHLTPGNLLASHQAYCGYNAGKGPQDGEVLDRDGRGGDTLAIDNRSVEPAVVRLRDTAGTSVASVFLSPGSHADLAGLPAGNYQAEYAIGELWSRACNSFAAGMRAWRLRQTIRIPGAEALVVTTDKPESDAEDMPQQVFERH
jgi:hypothetical protein